MPWHTSHSNVLLYILLDPCPFPDSKLCFPPPKQCIFNFCLRTQGLCGCLRKVAPSFQFALRFTPYSLISLHSLIASFGPLEIAFNYSCLFTTNTLEMELANKQCQATLILVYSKDPLMHWRSGRLLTGTCYCLQLLRNSNVDTVNVFTGAAQPWPYAKGAGIMQRREE